MFLPQIDGARQRAPDWEDTRFRPTSIREKSAAELKVALSLKGENRLSKSLPTKGGCKAKSQKSDKDQGGRAREDSRGWKSVYKYRCGLRDF